MRRYITCRGDYLGDNLKWRIDLGDFLDPIQVQGSAAGINSVIPLNLLIFGDMVVIPFQVAHLFVFAVV